MYFWRKYGILGVGINANGLQLYISGILDLTKNKCPSDEINHFALLVGYGIDSSSGMDYWIVKNHGGNPGEKLDILELEEDMALAV